MHTFKTYYLVLFCLLAGNLCCAQKHRAGSKDNPPVPQQNNQRVTTLVKRFYGDDNIRRIQKAQTITAYHLVEGVHAPQGFEGYKVITKVDSLTGQQADSLRKILLRHQTYVFDGVGKKCEFLPNIGFRFTQANDTLNVLVALSCNLLRYAQGNSGNRSDCDPAHNPFLRLCKSVFPQAFANYPYGTTPAKYRDDIPGRPEHRPKLPSLSVGTGSPTANDSTTVVRQPGSTGAKDKKTKIIGSKKTPSLPKKTPPKPKAKQTNQKTKK
jgi:hypothetical protein